MARIDKGKEKSATLRQWQFGIDIGKRKGMIAAQHQLVQTMVVNGYSTAMVAHLLNLSEAAVQQLYETPADAN